MEKVIVWLPLIVESVLSLICGLYQIIAKRESFLMWGMKRKYNYEQAKEKFVAADGILYVILGIFVAIVIAASAFLQTTPTEILLLSIPFLLLLGIGEFCMIKFYTNNLEKRRY